MKKGAKSKRFFDKKLAFFIVVIALIVVALIVININKEKVRLAPGVNAVCTGYGVQYTKVGDAACYNYISEKNRYNVYPDLSSVNKKVKILKYF